MLPLEGVLGGGRSPDPAMPVPADSGNHGIILRGKVGSGRWLTLWQAIIAIDPTFPKTGPCTTADGTVLEDWKRFPDRDLVLRAILFAADGKR